MICGSIRNRAEVAWWTLAFHGLSLLSLAWVLGMSPRSESSLLLTLTIMAWVTWASSSLAGSLRAAGEEFARPERASWPGPARTWSVGWKSGPMRCAPRRPG